MLDPWEDWHTSMESKGLLLVSNGSWWFVMDPDGSWCENMYCKDSKGSQCFSLKWFLWNQMDPCGSFWFSHNLHIFLLTQFTPKAKRSDIPNGSQINPMDPDVSWWTRWIPIDFYGYKKIKMDSDGSQWIQMGPYGYRWIWLDPEEYTESRRTPRDLLDPSGYRWALIDLDGSWWILMYPYGCRLIPMDLHGSRWILMDPNLSCWIQMDPKDPIVSRWTPMNYMDPKGSQLILMDLDWSRRIQWFLMNPDGPQWIQTYSDKFRWMD